MIMIPKRPTCERGGKYNEVTMHTSQGKGKKSSYRTIIRENEYAMDEV